MFVVVSDVFVDWGYYVVGMDEIVDWVGVSKFVLY